MYGAEAGLFAAQFPAKIRYSGVSLCFHAAAAIGGGLAPIIATLMLAHFGTTLSIGAYLIGVGLLASICVASMQRRTR
jgi:MFS transporter, MHS family, shikimate and dehydroshikimate transport protein